MAQSTWVELDAGFSKRVFVDTQSINSSGDSRNANIIMVADSGPKSVWLRVDCQNRRFKIGYGDWQRDDDFDPEPICKHSFSRLRKYSKLEIESLPPVKTDVVGAERNRIIVQDTSKHPFAAVGRLNIRISPTEGGGCTATLIGDSRTVLTARHCAIGSEYRFALGNSGGPISRKDGIPARIVAFGDFPVSDDSKNHWGPSPTADWDDWMVLDLETPSSGEPLAIPTPQLIRQIVHSFGSTSFLVAAFPSDINGGEVMTYSRGCGITISKVDYKQSHTSETGCASYQGSSGAALLIRSPEHQFVPVGVLSAGYAADTSRSFLVVGSRAFDVIRAKVRDDCQHPVEGLRFHPQACAKP
jgi:hypothetical protein